MRSVLFMFEMYVNPLYSPFLYENPQRLGTLQDVLFQLVDRFDGVRPSVDHKTQLELYWWSKDRGEQKPRLSVSWNVGEMTSELYSRLETVFQESLLGGSSAFSRKQYRSRGRSPSKFVGYDSKVVDRSRGFPIYKDEGRRLTEAELSGAKQLLWIGRNFSSIDEATKDLKGRGKSYWFYTQGKFTIDLRLEGCMEIEFLDAALRISVALNGSYDTFDRSQAISTAQKHLARLNAEQVSPGELIGLEDLVEEVKFRTFFASVYPEQAQALGIRNESVLLVGVPGTGKSSVASELLWDPQLDNVSLLPVNVMELLKAASATGKSLNGFFEGIKTLKSRYGMNTSLWCDDLEAAFLSEVGKTSAGLGAAQSSLLNALQGLSKDSTFKLSGTSNNPEVIDPRFLEFGRISYIYHVPVPRDEEVLSRILSLHMGNRGQVLDPEICVDEIAHNSVGFTPRMLDFLVNEAGQVAARRLFGRFSEVSDDVEALEVTAADYKAADEHVKSRNDLDALRKRDEAIGKFVQTEASSLGFKVADSR